MNLVQEVAVRDVVEIRRLQAEATAQGFAIGEPEDIVLVVKRNLEGGVPPKVYWAAGESRSDNCEVFVRSRSCDYRGLRTRFVGGVGQEPVAWSYILAGNCVLRSRRCGCARVL